LTSPQVPHSFPTRRSSDLIVTLGRFSMNKFLPGARISLVHGEAKKIKDRIVIPMYHPAAALRSQAMNRAFEEDFEKNKEILIHRSEEHTSELLSRGHLVCR